MTKKRLLAFFLTLVMLLTLCPSAALAAEETEDAPPAAEDAEPSAGDETEPPEEDSDFVFVPGVIPEESNFVYPDYDSDFFAAATDSKYDPRVDSNNPQTPVKDQDQNGLCWAFATYAAVEANYKKNHNGAEMDFSEMHMGYACSNHGGNAQGWNRKPGDGGNRTKAAAYLMRNSDGLSGAVMEADDRYTPEISRFELPDRDVSETMRAKKAYQVQNIMFLTGGTVPTPGTSNAGDMAAIKAAVLTYGGVGVCMFYAGNATTGEGLNVKCFNSATGAYYLSETQYGTDSSGEQYLDTNHLVEIVGWDDDYPAANFATTPRGDGAWLIKNSWGTDWWGSLDGYFWLSYYDTNCPSYAFCIDGVEAVDPKETVYETDYKADGAWFGGNGSTRYCAKVFTANTDRDQLTAVRVMVNQPGRVEVDWVSKETFLGGSYRFEAKLEKAVPYAGWYTVDVDTDRTTVTQSESFTTGLDQEFVIVVRVTSSGSTCYVCYDDYTSAATGSVYFGGSSGATWNTYVDFSGGSRLNNPNFCIKAVTVPGKTPLTADRITLDPAAYTYDGTDKTPAVKVNGVEVTAADFTVTYTNNRNAGTETAKPTVTVTATDANADYTGSASVTFTIGKADTTTTVTSSAPSIIIGGEAALTPAVKRGDAAVDGAAVTYSSSNEAVAAVDAGGKVTGKAAGTVTITAAYAGDSNHNGSSGTVEITVTSKPPLTVNAGDASITRTYGDTLTFTPSVSQNDAGTVTYSYSIKADSGDAVEAASDGTSLTIKKAGTATVIVTATPAAESAYSAGTAEVTVTVEKKSVTVKANDAARAYGEENPQFTFTVDASTPLVSGDTEADLGVTLTCAAGADTNVGTAPITGTGVSEKYAVTVTPGTLTIDKAAQTAPAAPTAAEVTDASITLTAIPGAEYSRDGTDWQDSAAFTGLNPNTEYTFYARLKEDGNHTASPNSPEAKIRTQKASLSGAAVTVTGSPFTYSGAAQTPGPTVELNGQTLVKDIDYTVAYENNVNAGTAIVIITGIGNYSGEARSEFTIQPKDISGVTVDAIDHQTFTGSEIRPAVTVRDTANIDAGSATVTVTGRGNYTGQTTAGFTIDPKALAPQTVDADLQAVAGKTAVVDLSRLVPANSGGTPAYTKGSDPVHAAAEISADGRLNLIYKVVDDTQSVPAAESFTVTISGMRNYGDLTVTVTVNYTDKTVLPLAIAPAAGLTYDGAAKPVTVTGADGVGLTYRYTGVNRKGVPYDSSTAPTDAGSYTVVVSVNDPSYAGSATANFVIAQAAATVTADNLTVTAGGTPAYTATISPAGANLGFTPTFTCAYTTDSGVGTYEILPSGADVSADGNYTVTYRPGTLTVSSRPAGHQHSWAAAWASDSAYHWHNCTAAGCTAANSEKSGYGPHTYDGASDATCNICGYTRAVSTPGYPNTPSYPDFPGDPNRPDRPDTPDTPDTPDDGDPDDPVIQLPVNTDSDSQDGASVTRTTAVPPATASDGAARSEVDAAIGAEIVRQAVSNGSDHVVIAPEITERVTRVEVSIPASTVEQLRSQTKASLTISTPVAAVTIPNGGLGRLAGTDGTVTVTAERVGRVVTLSVMTADGRSVTDIPGGVTLAVPAAGATPGTVAVLIRDDGTREVVRKSVEADGSVTIPLDGSARVEIADNSRQFDDVPAGSWAADAVAFASAREIFNGTSPTQFSPEQPMSRGMLAVALYNLENNPASAFVNLFSDVDSGAWYAEGVVWAASEGIVTGYGNGRFGPKDNITREQLAVMLWRYAGKPAAESNRLDFGDAGQVSNWALDALCWATENGIINGKGAGVLDPAGYATRAETAQMLKNYLENQ